MIHQIILAMFLLIGLFFLGIGMKVILTKRPLVISSRWLRCIMAAALLPILLRPMMHSNANSLFPAIMWVLIVAVVWRQTNGYSIFGIANPAFRESLIVTLNNLNIQFQEDMTGITIPSENIKLETNVMSNGVARLRIKDKRHADWLKELAEALKKYYNSTPVQMTLAFSIFYCIFGAIFLLFMLNAILSH